MKNTTLTDRETRRFQSQIDLENIGSSGQEKIKNARILVIGAGGKGTSALKTLISAGVGFIGVSDDTLVQEETLARQSLYNDNDIGKQMAIVSKQYLQTRNNLTNIKVHNIRLNSDNISKVIEDYNVLIDATNNFTSHYSINEASVNTKKPMIFGNITNNMSYITTLNNTRNIELKEILKTTKEIKDGNDADRSTPLIVVNSITGVIMANEAIRIVLELPSQLNDNLLIIKLSDYSFSLQPY
jgi:adenylyltransferase/sulfurtransferase